MKLVHRNIEKDGKGTITLIPEESEDMWHAYNLIAIGDGVRASTVRKVLNESATGSTTSNRVRTTLTITVENIDFDTQACVLRLKGRNIEENQYVKLGAYHTLDLELNRKFTLTKDEWDSVALERIETACDPTKSADAAAITMQEGLAYICLITSNMTIVRAKIDVHIPKKRKGNAQQYEKGLAKFYEMVLQGILRHVNFDIIKVVLIASPGFIRDQFYEYMFQEAVKCDYKVLIENKSKFLLIHSSTGFKHSLKEVLSTPVVMSKMADTKALSEVKALEKFYETLQADPDKAYYGINHVEKANDAQAIETLLITDSLFRCNDVKERKRYVNLVDSVRECGGDVKIFSSMHISGEQLTNLTGVAAILRFPLPDLDENDSEDESDDDDDPKKCDDKSGDKKKNR
ncbi:protein pelota [Planococcus citri]|uniref:protein pelota n=1 Tax=Planococcus citri TaxID=170843 RepID=UPI0031F88C98